MNLGNWLADNIILEQSNIKTVVAIYPGRFQPMGKHHAAVFANLQEKFGPSNTFIVTSDKTEKGRSPFNFEEKKKIINKHGIQNVVQVKNPYQATELLSKFDADTTAVVFAVGDKDMKENPRFRIGTKKDGSPSYFQSYEDNKNNLLPYSEHGYLDIAKKIKLTVPGYGEMSGTSLRDALSNIVATKDLETFNQIMGWDIKEKDFENDELWKIFKNGLLGESIETFLTTFDMKQLLKEASYSTSSGKQVVDDGPRYFYGNQASYRKGSVDMAKSLGYTVLNYLVPESQFPVHDTDFPKGPPLAVSFFPVGIPGGEEAGTDYLGKDLSSSSAYKEWSKYISNVAQRVGYKFLNFLGADESTKQEKPKETDGNMISEMNWKKIFEDINVPVNIGDTVLMGKFKNKKVVVKTITKNEKGDYLINGRPAFKFRLLPKQDPVNEIGDAGAKTYDFKKDSVGYMAGEGGRSYNFTTDSGTKYTVELGIEEDWSDTSGDHKIMRVEFGIESDAGKFSHKAVVNKGELFKVMATITKIVKETISQIRGIKTINFSASKNSPEDTRRLKLYLAYVKKQFPNAEVEMDSDVEANVYLPESINEGILSEAKANTHLTHLEELILTQGLPGYKKARSFILELVKNLKGHSNAKVNTSVKWDGAPALFAGINPENGKFFVGTKSIFNKEPKINYTKEDVDMNHGHAPGLADKLKQALDYLPGLGIKNILQGDFMFDKGMLKSTNIDGVPHYTFRPNTITYAVEADSELGKKIANSKFGIVFHTTYNDLQGGASFGADVSGLKRVPGVWFDDAYFKDTTGTVTLSDNEAKEALAKVKAADSIKVNYDNIPADMLNIYINSEIRKGELLADPNKSFENFKAWYQAQIDKKVEKLKTDKGKARTAAAGEEKMNQFEAEKNNILNIFKITKLLAEAKLIFVNKYNNAVYKTKHFKDDGQGGLEVTAPEGYVAVDHIGNGVKLVDRIEFSRANFAMDKGFAK